MRSCFSLDVSRHKKVPFNIGCLLAVIFAVLCANAQTPSPDPDDESTDSQPNGTAHHESPKKIAKYDITRIGSRGVGHGFNIYSLKREHQLGESLAANFDHSSRIVSDPILNEYVSRVAQRLA